MSVTFYPTGDTSSETYVNLANANAIEALVHLGVEVDYCGSISAADLRSRLPRLAALSPLPDRDIEHIAAGGARIIECGHPAGYWQDVADRLLVVCAKAETLEGTVTWA